MNLPITELLFIGLLTLLEAFFVAAEIALVSVRRSRIDQLVDEGDRAAARVRRLLDDPGRFLAVSQLGLTVIGFFASAYAAVSLTEQFTSLLEGIGVSHGTAQAVSLVTVTVLLALFTIIFAELVPKTIALANADRVARAVSRPIDVLARILGPLIALITAITRAVSGLFGADVNQEAQISAEELKLIVERGGEQGVLEAEEEQMIHAVIELGERRLHEVMVPRIDMVALGADASFEEAIDIIVGGGHSRIPVYEGTVDEIVGILYAKDLLTFLKGASAPRPTLRALLRTPVFVPESMTIDDLLHEFQRRKVHLAIVLDEYGGTAGLVTIEDLLEEIVGEIQDEYDVEEPMVEKLSDDEARIDGRASIDDLAEAFDLELELEDDDEYDTVGGLIFHRLGDVPEPGDRITVESLMLTVESTDGRRVAKVLAVRDRGERDGLADDEADR